MSTTFPIDVTVARLVEFHGLADVLCLQELGRRPGHTPDDAVGEIIELLALQGQTGDQIQAWLHDQPEAIAYRTQPVPPDWTPARLRTIRGAIWPTRGPVAFGPRPGQPDNIIDTGCEAYSAADLSLARSILTARQYTHVQMGPFIDGGYHGQYPPVDFRTNPDAVLALIESWWAAGFAVVAFIGPDGWTTEQMRELEPIFLQPRWQAAMKQIVPMGWEPSEDTPNAEFVARYQWARRVFPNALQYIHLAADFDAPGNNDDFTPGQPKFIGHAESWRRVCPYLTGWLVQNGPYDCFPHDNPTLLKNFTDQFRADAHGSLRDRFVNGYDGWPTTCASGEPLDLINAENTSYEAYWKNLPEEASRQWGHAALQAGADGFFDGGIV